MADVRQPDDAESEPPPDADRTVAMLWRMAALIRSLHWAGTDNYCMACGQRQVCEANRLACEALQEARMEYVKRQRANRSSGQTRRTGEE